MMFKCAVFGGKATERSEGAYQLGVWWSLLTHLVWSRGEEPLGTFEIRAFSSFRLYTLAYLEVRNIKGYSIIFSCDFDENLSPTP